MATLWKSILLSQPADGDTVFIRRGAQDPPVQAIWAAATATFTVNGVAGVPPGLPATVTITIVGPDHPGIWPSPFVVGAGGNAGSFQANLVTPPSDVFCYNDDPDLTKWKLGLSQGSDGYISAEFLWHGATHMETVFFSFGSPGFAAPTSLTVTPVTWPILIPAWGVSAWRPL